MFLSRTIADEIRAAFPAKDELETRLAIRDCWRENRNPREVADTIGLTSSGLRRLDSLATWLEAEKARLGMGDLD